MINYIKKRNYNSFLKKIPNERILDIFNPLDFLSTLKTKKINTAEFVYLCESFPIHIFHYNGSQRNKKIFYPQNWEYLIVLLEINDESLKNEIINYQNNKFIFLDDTPTILSSEGSIYLKYNLSVASSHERSNIELTKKLTGLDYLDMIKEISSFE